MTEGRVLLHFLLLGALLFAAKLLTADGRALGIGVDPIRISAAEVERLRAEWAGEMRRYPTHDELAALLRHFADQETLHREALRLGLDRTDPVVRSRLVQNMRFVRGDAMADEADLFAEALALGMSRRDVVARRRLVQAMEERLAATARVGESDVLSYVALHADRYGARRRVAFTQVFLDAERHRDELGAATERLQAQLAALPTGSGVPPLGDPFLLGHRFPPASETEIARTFGTEFAQRAMRANASAWTGPIRSVYGIHFVRVDRTAPAAPADLAVVRRQAHYALLEEREQQTVRERLQALRRLYPLEVEWPALARAGRP